MLPDPTIPTAELPPSEHWSIARVAAVTGMTPRRAKARQALDAALDAARRHFAGRPPDRPELVGPLHQDLAERICKEAVRSLKDKPFADAGWPDPRAVADEALAAITDRAEKSISNARGRLSKGLHDDRAAARLPDQPGMLLGSRGRPVREPARSHSR